MRENEEKLVSLKGISEKIIVDPYYYKKNIPGSIDDCYLRESAAELLLQAAKFLKDNHYFIVYDAWRPYKVQLALYQQFEQELKKKGIPEHQLKKVLRNYVDVPSKDPMKPANHLTGGAIDLTIACSGEGILNMGTGFDDFSEKSATDYYEKLSNLTKEEQTIRDNRRYLKEVMEKAGFTNYPEEWWHFDYGNQNWGKATGNIAIYGGILEIEHDK
ncbi:MAG TPA: M15 family metallopeptidase [Bacillota bacterium]|nr:M15 family metallopeptidase [Bacillota bacterium]